MRCPNCKEKLVYYDGRIIEYYCVKCDYEKYQNGREKYTPQIDPFEDY